MYLPDRPEPWTAQRSTYFGLLTVVCLFCAPLFAGLTGWDLDNDEAIYSYAVDRMLETGDWLTPRAIPYDGPFLEKPPAKFWIVAAAIRAGVLPRDEFGLRFMDALFGSVAFMYVFFLGRWLAGPFCGVVSVLVLFTLDPLIFEHGLRSNNMEAALVLCFCGGVYHFARWVEDGSTKRAAIHALAVAAYFTLGFMTKFVAALFLPLVCAVAIAWRRGGLRRVRSGWRDWSIPLLFVLAVTAPWFVYQAVHAGRALWETMFEEHVYERFTVGLDARHLQPWNYYYSHLWLELVLAGSHWIGAFGVVMLAAKAWTGRPWLARLLFVWWMLPIALMSLGTSKAFHYAYPFLLPVALGAGAVAQALFDAVEPRARIGVEAIARALGPAGERRVNATVVRWLVAPPAVTARLSTEWGGPLLLAAALLGLVVAVWTALIGPVRWELNGFPLLRNSSVFRPLLISAILLYLSGYLRARYVRAVISRTVAIGAVGIVLPVFAYPLKLERAMSVRHPLRSLRDCAISLGFSRPETHVYLPYGDLLSHSYYYYLRRVGPWVEHERPRIEELQAQAAGNRLMLMSRVDYSRLDRAVGAPGGLALSARDFVIIATPGQFETCAAPAVASGAAEVRTSRRAGS